MQTVYVYECAEKELFSNNNNNNEQKNVNLVDKKKMKTKNPFIYLL